MIHKQMSTLGMFADETHPKQYGDTKTCLIYGLRYYFRTIHYREHLGLTDSLKQVYQCKPYPEHAECYAQVSWR